MTRSSMKPTLFQVALQHEEVLDDISRAAQVLPQLVEAVVAGVWVEQAVFDAVLHGFNQVAGTHYTQDDLREVHILTDAQLKGMFPSVQGTAK